MIFFPRSRAGKELHSEILENNDLPGQDSLVAAPLTFLECGPAGALAALDREGRVAVLDPSEVSLLQAFKRPCELQDIPDRLRAQGWECDDLSHAHEMIGTFQKSGFLHSIGSLIETSRARPFSDTVEDRGKAGYSLLGIPTQDRPEILARALATWNAFPCSNMERTPLDIMIADDSQRELAATRSVVDAFAPSNEGATYFLDYNFRRSLAEALTPSGGRAAAFALGLDGGITGLGLYGASRNFIMLSAAGHCVGMADDDMIPDLREHPLSCDGLALSSEPDPTIVRPFADRSTIEAWILDSKNAEAGRDRLLLGRSVSELLLEATSLDLRNADSSLLDSSFNSEAKISALCYGTWGDSGIPANRYLLGLRNMVDTGFPSVYEDGTYQAALESRLIFRAPLRTTIGGKTFMGGHIALDARSILPPFSPRGRDEDGLWGFCLGILQPKSFVAYPRQAVLHEPPQARKSTREDALNWDHCLNETLKILLGMLGSRLETGSAAYSLLGNRLTTIAIGPRQELRHTLAEATARSISARIALLEKSLSLYSIPAAWVADVETAITALATRLERLGFYLPRELSGMDEKSAENALAEYLLRYGELLHAWPSMFAAAEKLAPDLLQGRKVTK